LDPARHNPDNRIHELIHGEEAVRFVDDGHLSAKRLGYGLERSPTGSGARVVLNARNFLRGHCRSDLSKYVPDSK
jgi:hypothetical protein